MSHRLIHRSIRKLTLKIPPRPRSTLTTRMEEIKLDTNSREAPTTPMEENPKETEAESTHSGGSVPEDREETWAEYVMSRLGSTSGPMEEKPKGLSDTNSGDSVPKGREETWAEHAMSRLSLMNPQMLIPSGPFDEVYKNGKLQYITAENYPYPSSADLKRMLGPNPRKFPEASDFLPPMPPWTPESKRGINTTGLSYSERFDPKRQ